MSLFTKKMNMLTAIVLDDKSSAVVKALLKEGVMDFVHIKDFHSVKDGQLTDHNSKLAKAHVSDLRSRLDFLFSLAAIQVPSFENVELSQVIAINLDSFKRSVERLTNSISKLKDKQQEISRKALLYDELERYIDEEKNDYLDFRVGGAKNNEDLALRLMPLGGLFFNYNDNYISLTLKRDIAKVNDLFDKFNWMENPKISQNEVIQEAKVEIKIIKEKLEDENSSLAEEIKQVVIKKQNELEEMWLSLRLCELTEYVESYFSHTKNTTLFSGWVPSDLTQIAEDAILEATNGNAIIQWKDDSEFEREQIPVEVKSSKALKPFEKMVTNYATPEYGSINPTIFTTIAYILMFMLMFADLGQGFILLLVGLIGKNSYKKNPMKKDGLISRGLCDLLLYLGPASMFGGLLFGSCFGYTVIPALWFNYHHVVNGTSHGGLINSVYDILGLTIKFGIGVVSTGLILNWINLIIKKKYLLLIFDKNGLVGGLLYTLGIWACFYFVGSGYKEFPSNPILYIGIAIGLLMLLLKGPIYALYNAKKHGHKEKVSKIIMDTIMDFLIEALEIFSGFLSNTLSFMRVAGLGIAHVSLMTAFHSMALMTGNIFFEILIMILGNVLVIAIEGLSAGIQSLRLNYYEFFTKYFNGRGVAFEPVGLKSRIRLDN